MSFPVISIPRQSDLWLNIDSDHSVISWYTLILERRRNMMKMLRKMKTLKSKNTSKLISEETKKHYEKKWRRIFFDFCEKNYNSDDDVSDDSDDGDEDVFSFFKNK
jgi:hypothetical protein